MIDDENTPPSEGSEDTTSTGTDRQQQDEQIEESASSQNNDSTPEQNEESSEETIRESEQSEDASTNDFENISNEGGTSSSLDEDGEDSSSKNASEDIDSSAENNEEPKELTEEERQALEWEQMMSSESQTTVEEDDWGDIEGHKTLDQSEIDNLIGDFGTVETTEKLEGSKILFSSKTVYYERLPMLEVVFDRLVRMMSTTLRNFASTNVDVSLTKMYSIRFGDYLSSIPLPAMIAVVKAVEWENQGLVFVDSNTIYSIVDVLLGNRRGPLLKIEGRPYTTIERQLIQRMMRLIMFDLRDAFEPITTINFDFERLEINPDFAAIARESNAALVARLQLLMDDRVGMLEFVLPYATIEPVRELLLQNFMGEKFGRDAIWERHLEEQLWGTDVEIQATFPGLTKSLLDVLNWQVGSHLHLDATPQDPVEMRCGNHLIGKGHIGHKSGKIAIRLDNILQKQVE